MGKFIKQAFICKNKMRNKAFISIYVLLLLLVLSITVTFIYDQNQNDMDFNKDLYNKKQGLYMAESSINLAAKEKEFREFLSQSYNKMKEYYKDIIVRGIIEYKIEEKKVLNIDYENKKIKVNIKYVMPGDKIILESNAINEDTSSYAKIYYKIKPKFEFKQKSQILYDFHDDLVIKNDNYIENSNHIDLEEVEIKKENEKENEKLDFYKIKKDSKFYKLNSDLIILKEEKNDEKNSEKIENDDKKGPNKFAKFTGSLYLKGDLILERNLVIDGLLILDGNLICKTYDGKIPKLKVNGQIITKNEIKKELLELNYEKHSYLYVMDIENLFDIEFTQKKVY